MTASVLLHEALDATAARRPDKLALVSGEQRLTFDELARRSRRYSQRLRACGVERGDRVVLFMDNGAALAACLYAVLRIGAVCVPVNPQTKADKLQGMVARTRARMLLGQASLAPVWRAAMAGSAEPCTVGVLGEVAAPQGHELAWDSIDESPTAIDDAEATTPDSPAFISHTSGTTGIPKGVVLSHRNLSVVTDTIAGYLGLAQDDVVLGVLPLSFNYGLTQLLLAGLTGATLVLERSFAFPVRTLQLMARERVSVLPAVPTMYSMLLALGDFNAATLPSLRLMTSASAALVDVQASQLKDRFPQARLVVMYGQTECTRISYLPPEQFQRRPGSVGRGLPGQECWLRDETGRRLPWGSAGELVVQGDHVMLGYWEDAGATGRKIHVDPQSGQRTLFTGDLFRSDGEGWLYFLERMDDIIKTRGEKVSPREVEQAILRIEGVSECLVVGVPDPLLGQAVKAYVACAPGAALQERQVIRHCLATLESYMAPRSVAFVDALPRTYNGKVRKHDLP
jgi:acyl-CoA synthetase (AMP-forming)/AMP-acid ligase II